MSENTECPYCNHDQEFCFDDGATEGERYEQECANCEKTYVVEPYYILGFHEHKSDCLNGGPEHSSISTTFGGGTITKRCEDCGKTISRVGWGDEKQ